MTAQTLHTIQVIVKGLLYLSLFYEGYRLLKFVRRNTLLHQGVVIKLRLMSYLFTVLLLVKIAFNIITLINAPQAPITHVSDAYTAGYVAGQATGRVAAVVLQNADLIFAIAFIWMLIFVFNEALRLKIELELTV